MAIELKYVDLEGLETVMVRLEMLETMGMVADCVIVFEDGVYAYDV